MRFSNLSLRLAAVILLQAGCQAQDSNRAIALSAPCYTVSFDPQNLRAIHVAATLLLKTDTLYMSQSDVEPLNDGFAHFVDHLSATTSDGKKIKLQLVGSSMWKLSVPVPSTVYLSYDVTIGHDAVPWSVSAAFARGYATPDVVFFAGRAVFITPRQVDTNAITIQYLLPAQWKIENGYTAVNEPDHVFRAPTLADLWRNGNFAGHFVQKEIQVNQLRIEIAGTEQMAGGVELFRSALSGIVEAYNTEMGGAPEGKLAIMASVCNLPAGGESFRHSISMSFMRSPDMSNKSRWGYLLAHEVFHLWNGQAIAPAQQSQVEWFVEGFTEYMCTLAACKTGLISQTEFLQQLSNSRNSYLAGAGKVSLKEAGLQKGLNYGLIYDGGMSVALALDIGIRQASGNSKSLIDLMKAMYTQFGKTGIPYSYEDIVRTTSAVTGKDISDFFKKYVSGIEVIPVDKYLSAVGLEAVSESGQSQIRAQSNATDAQKQLLQSILSKP